MRLWGVKVRVGWVIGGGGNLAGKGVWGVGYGGGGGGVLGMGWREGVVNKVIVSGESMRVG